MQRLNQDTTVAIVLLVFCGVCFWASFDIRQPDYGVLLPSTWPRVILGVLSLLSFTYLVQSIRRDSTVTSTTPETHLTSVSDWLRYWRNPLYCFGLFLAYLLMLPILGMLLAGMTFVFLLQSLLGGWHPRRLLMHAVVAILSVGGMWSVFTFGLDVMLPSGIILPSFN